MKPASGPAERRSLPVVSFAAIEEFLKDPSLLQGSMEKKYPAIAGREKVKECAETLEFTCVSPAPLCSGPGPGRYGLPPTIGFVGHDFTKATSPAYSFHGKMSDNMYCVDSSPGPRYHVDSKITRFGKDGTPSFSMLGRTKEQSKFPPLHFEKYISFQCTFSLEHELLRTPGPGAYSPEKAAPCNVQRRPPSYTMGSRTLYRSVDSVPAPNKYVLPPLMGPQVPNKPASASYTLLGTYSTGGPSVDLAKTPGPCRYNSTDPGVYLHRQPAYSMLGRHSFPRDATKKPGPGTYNPEKVTVHKARAPAFSLGIRHSEFVTPLVLHISD
ncbi:outer dense fiber protein 3-like protein 2b [Limanda limanda]|uniref:outer dense fiber protein 3-like protein 2b n=1 Tax=Limanda limanda TaxID=27771 RepID=UPI0029C8A53E|nr:outer dense fiber protein 3-like protein 2b [Limanda limanda]